MIGAVDCTLDVAQQSVHLAQPRRLAAALAASGDLRLVFAASRLHAPETGRTVRAHQRSRSQVPLGPGSQRPLAEARHRAQLQLLWTLLGADLRRRHEGRLAGGTTPPLAPA